MPYCSLCGVEVDGAVKSCPLCDARIFVSDESSSGEESRYPKAVVPEPLTNKQRRMVAWACIASLCIAAFLVTLAVDLIMSQAITWSRYAMASLAAAFVFSTTSLLIFRRGWVIILANFAPTIALLAGLDIADGTMEWFLTLGLPIVSSVAAVMVAMLVLWATSREKGANLMAIGCILFAVLCIGVDLLISGWIGDAGMSWSFVVLAVAVPLSVFLFVYHFVLRKYFRFSGIFHI